MGVRDHIGRETMENRTAVLTRPSTSVIDPTPARRPQVKINGKVVFVDVCESVGPRSPPDLSTTVHTGLEWDTDHANDSVRSSLDTKKEPISWSSDTLRSPFVPLTLVMFVNQVLMERIRPCGPMESHSRKNSISLIAG